VYVKDDGEDDTLVQYNLLRGRARFRCMPSGIKLMVSGWKPNRMTVRNNQDMQVSRAIPETCVILKFHWLPVARIFSWRCGYCLAVGECRHAASTGHHEFGSSSPPTT